MKEVSVSLPDEILERIEKIEKPSDYLRNLVYSDLLIRGNEDLDAQLEKGLQSGDSIEVDASYWERKKASLAAKHDLEEHAS
ncbi:MAG: type II toxin-antitoxin system ParD family antitoxin [Candidatus Omnitrophica bacterium]|nr:type II toxin-antitoxin system ParD family antitoxin [Candidatus Omnitrophota bacterium]MCA9444977.1 type II toxin-antitoxin system ParD family antitoxin [Candidatus Omnitrophota bacterium]MCB9767606.1 type II toxin-antitoxin system ParD family antitoxin [Candidatus Omnitrophota bacterium]